MFVCRLLCTEQAESFPPTKNAISNEFVVVFSNAGGRARGKATVSAFTANATAVVVGEYKNALHGLTVRGKPALVAALIANHPDAVLSIEMNVVVRTSGTQAISSTFPISPGLWGLDRIDQVGACIILAKKWEIASRVSPSAFSLVPVVPMCWCSGVHSGVHCSSTPTPGPPPPPPHTHTGPANFPLAACAIGCASAMGLRRSGRGGVGGMGACILLVLTIFSPNETLQVGLVALTPSAPSQLPLHAAHSSP
jgi:hypothetical protein